MKTHLLAPLLLLCVCASAQTPTIAPTLSASRLPATTVQLHPVALQAVNAEWRTYSYPSDGFSISGPSQPEQQKQTISTAIGPIELRAYLAEAGETALYVGVCDYGDGVRGRDPDSVLQGAKNGAVTNTKAHVLRERKISLGIYNGLEFEAENDSLHFSGRIYLVGGTLYQTLSAAPLTKPYNETQRFLDSFQLIARTR